MPWTREIVSMLGFVTCVYVCANVCVCVNVCVHVFLCWWVYLCLCQLSVFVFVSMILLVSMSVSMFLSIIPIYDIYICSVTLCLCLYWFSCLVKYHKLCTVYIYIYRQYSPTLIFIKTNNWLSYLISNRTVSTFFLVKTKIYKNDN